MLVKTGSVILKNNKSVEKLRETFLTSDYDFEELRRFYQNGGAASDFVELLDDPDVRIDALYGLAEIGESAQLVWKSVLPYVGSSVGNEAFWALNTVLAFATDADSSEILYCLEHADLSDQSLFESIFDLLMTRGKKYPHIFDRLFDQILTSKMTSAHGSGCLLLIAGCSYNRHSLEHLLSKKCNILNLYVYVYIAVFCWSDNEINTLLPCKLKASAKNYHA